PAAGLVRPVTLVRPARALPRRPSPEPVAGHVHQGSADDRRSADGNQPNDGGHRDDIRHHGREQLARSTPVTVSRLSSQTTTLIYPRGSYVPDRLVRLRDYSFANFCRSASTPQSNSEAS